MKIDVLIDNEFKKQVRSTWLKKIMRLVLEKEKVDTHSEVTLVLAGDDKLHELNLKYLGEDRPTDVMSFPMNEHVENQPQFVHSPGNKNHLGDVIISYPQAIRQAGERGHTTERELVILVIHGILHLLGYDHDIAEREQVMGSKESAILKIIEEQGI